MASSSSDSSNPCRNCGEPLVSGSNFCPMCGRPTKVPTSSSDICPRCGNTVVRGNYCATCGNGLRLPPTVSFTPSSSAALDASIKNFRLGLYSSSSQAGLDYERHTAIDRTKNGLLLLIIGLLLGPVPLLNYLGGLLDLIGVILIILGRSAFGPDHSSFVLWSVVIWVVGFLVLFLSALGFASSLIQALNNGGNAASVSSAVSSAVSGFYIAATIGVAVTGLATVMLTYNIQDLRGRLLLWAGLVASIVIGVVVFSIISDQLSNAVQRLVSSAPTGTLDRSGIDALMAQGEALRLLQFIPAIMFAVAYYMLWNRINRGEIPETKTLEQSQIRDNRQSPWRI